MTDLTDLRRLAEAARRDGMPSYLAAADPTTILALLDERDRLRAALEDLYERLTRANDIVDSVTFRKSVRYQAARARAAIRAGRHDDPAAVG